MPLGESCLALYAPQADTNSTSALTVHDLGVGLPAFGFLAFLIWRAQPSLRKLHMSRSHIMATYYGFMWLCGVFGVVRSLAQIFEAHTSPHPTLYNTVWLGTRFGLVLLEVSVLVFLLQGHLVSGQDALLQSVILSGAVAAAETLVAAALVFGAGVPLFLYGGLGDDPAGDMQWGKWGFWLLHTLLFGGIYAAMLALPFTRWRDRLPAKPSFYRYVMVLFGLNIGAALGALLLGSQLEAGYCVYGLAHWVYFALLPLLIYMTFLAEFFHASDGLEQLHYSEMRDSGWFEDDLSSST